MHELLTRRHPNARPRNGLLARLGGALARPWQTSYVCPSLMTATAVAYALRGYEPYWTPVTAPHGADGGRNPSSVAYRIYKPTDDGRYPSHGVSLQCIAPRWAILAECNARNAVGRTLARLVTLTKSVAGGSK